MKSERGKKIGLFIAILILVFTMSMTINKASAKPSPRKPDVVVFEDGGIMYKCFREAHRNGTGLSCERLTARCEN